MEEKSLLRGHYRGLRRSIFDVRKAAEMLKENCMRNVKLRKGGTVAGYIPRDGEIDVLPLMQFVKEEGNTVLVPVVQQGSRLLAFKRWNCYASGEETIIPEVLFVPLVAFDRSLNRLGFGGGYYDYTIAFFRRSFRCLCIGVAYNAQLHHKIPVAEHDQKLDLIITESDVYRNSATGCA
ncbi:5-formyltetrahydrofolate cyclo-ligase [Anaplasma marginale]|uniref:5-formyltetrahydrofolate cyclo-ligase n=4 Tax=Anaplasma marginale TaxID=770 RepID=B9KIK1_ANAMF|nr:5-formyltetrahydrofolate cyclo-ligase [Anaplasma marginale]ACM49313.1 5-formyltetrahydrofolate cyclo-ligase [Anaplasma marginale str. Florida]AGZ78850.1 5-formyltetrahydrofolate cyclo-ligase [Anaplasma marginale str. Gypsy Plains]AXW84049.1 5-formyltetrahydrofolate cyclo-ligase [Anaplasma marginale]AXW84968.1 5-formyltetrahydrofolate cyclo-ligase [Anaplasma marginale]KAA8472499.1 5-formyltetrahydrofolate cyclo-ligase [Anaplasma marginale]